MAAILRLRMEERRVLRRERTFIDRRDPLQVYNDGQLIERYRMLRDVILNIVEQLKSEIEHPTKRSNAIAPHMQVLVCLRFLSKGTFQSETAEIHGVSIPSASRCVGAVTKAICTEFRNAIGFPNETHLVNKMKSDFYNISNFPNVIGVVDGTLIPIAAPSIDEPAFVCRKNFHAINVQAISDANLRFINVVSRWPGSVHDSFIWRNSGIAQKFERGEFDGWILGDSGYALKPWLLTPLAHPVSPGERRFNKCFKTIRCSVERAFGILKSRYRCLHKSGGCLMYSPKKACSIILASFILHNICIEHKLPEPELLEQDEDGDDEEYVYEGDENDEDGDAIRKKLIQNRFS